MSAEPTSHDVWRDSAALFALDALDGTEREAFETHLSTCAECRDEIESLRPVVHALAAVVPQVDPPAALRTRVTESVRGGAPGVGFGSATSITAGEARAAAGRPADTPARRTVPQPYWLGLAATVALAVGLGTYAVSLRGRIAGLESDLRTALAQAENQLALATEARRALVSTERRLEVLAAPDGARVLLAGQPASPNATGRADWSRSQGLAVAVGNLPPLRANRTYQVWLLTAGAPISIGLLEPNADGGQVAVFPNPPGTVEPTGVALSEEPAGGLPAPTGQLYLVGLMAQAR